MKTENFSVVGKSTPRVDFADKATGKTKYTNDISMPAMLHAKLHTSTRAHAMIKSINLSKAWEVMGVQAILTGSTFPFPVGPMLADRPPLAVNKVRYFGEPVAVVVADKEHQAKQASSLIDVVYEDLPVVNSPTEGVNENAPLVHEKLGDYKVQVKNVYPTPNTNIANQTKIRKGSMTTGWQASDVTVESQVSFTPADHAALETRTARVEIMSDGRVVVHTSSQGPFYVRKLLSEFFKIDAGMITVHTPLVGGAFGGKGTVQLEFIAYLASKAVGGRPVNVENSREEDLITSPVHIGLDATVKLGASKDGKLQAAELHYLFDGGAYSDTGIGISKAAASDCTGPYAVDNVWCDSYCIYTNHPYATSFRGFGHPELTFAIERAMDKLAEKLQIDPLELRILNAIGPGDTTPTQVQLNASNIGDITSCLKKLKGLIGWDSSKDGQKVIEKDGKIKTKGISCFWKNSSTPTNATAGAILVFNTDGSINLNCAAVELGQGSKTVLAQILAEKFKMEMKDIHVTMEVNTHYDPHKWKTVASSTTFIAGRAVLAAAENAIVQLKKIGSIVLQCSLDDLDIAKGEIFIKDSPEYGVKITKVAVGYKYPNGHTTGGLIVGEGSYNVRHLTPLDPETGFGKPGPQWTVGAHAVETEYNPEDHTYKIVKAAIVLDPGKVINPKGAIGQMRGGMYMGLSWASRESFMFGEDGEVLNRQLRTYDILRLSEVPEYLVDFVETPLISGPYGARGMGEYGVIGTAGALGNSLTAACGVNLDQLPLTPELIWTNVNGGKQ